MLFLGHGPARRFDLRPRRGALRARRQQDGAPRRRPDHRGHLGETRTFATKSWPDLQKDTDLDYRITNFDLKPNAFNVLPAVAAESEDSFQGLANYEKRGTFTARLAAIVVDTLPNGNLVVNGRREIKIDNEVKVIEFSGVVRRYDIHSRQLGDVREGRERQGALHRLGSLDQSHQPSRHRRLAPRRHRFRVALLMLQLLAISALVFSLQDGESDRSLADNAATLPVSELDVSTLGAQAPTQPRGTSSSTVTRTRRIEPVRTAAPINRLLTPIERMVAVRGQEDNPVMGIGLVTGLAGTGDSGNAARQLLQNLLLTRNINIPTQDLSSKNVAIVRVEASMPAGVKPGRRLDVRVSTIGDAESLVGGTLAFTELTDVTGSGRIRDGRPVRSPSAVSRPKAKAPPRLATTSPSARCRAAAKWSAKYRHASSRTTATSTSTCVSRIRASATPSRSPTRSTSSIPVPPRRSRTAKTIKVRVPADLPKNAHIAYLDMLLRQEVESENYARVILNERTGVIVMGGDVPLCVPARLQHGNLTVTISETPEVSQPGPLSNGETQVLDRTNLDVEEEDSPLIVVPGAVSLQEVVDVLNVLGTSPRDLISILQAMSQGGLLVAEIYRM